MEYVIVGLAALAASGLTLFSGFGLGTLLMPVVAIFFPLELAIAMTAIVHLANNTFKVLILGRKADRRVIVAFGLPAIIAAVAGAALLNVLGSVPSIYEYSLQGRTCSVSPLKLLIGILVLSFVYLELADLLKGIELATKWMALGGVVSGFFGGLSGHQGAFRSMFLLRAGLSKDAFVSTGIVLAVMVDISRILVYGAGSDVSRMSAVDWSLVGVACLSAFLGATVGAKFLKKMTIRSIQVIVSLLLVVVALGLMSGLL